MLTHVSSRCEGEVPSTKSSNEAASWQDLPCCVGWGTRHGSAGEGGGFVAPDVVEELAVQLFYPRTESVGGYVEDVVCWGIVAASICGEGVFAKRFYPLHL